MIQQLQLYFSHKLFSLKINLGQKDLINCFLHIFYLCKNDIRSKAFHCITEGHSARYSRFSSMLYINYHFEFKLLFIMTNKQVQVHTRYTASKVVQSYLTNDNRYATLF